MSVGHRHHRANLLVPGPQLTEKLHRVLQAGGAPELMQRWKQFDGDCDIVYTAGYNVPGTTRFADRDFVRALYDDLYSKKLLGSTIDTGLSPDDTLECVLWHEATEKVILDADNPFDFYDHHLSPGGIGAHELATVAEHELVKKKGGTPLKYERGLKAIIKFCMTKPLNRVAKDYSCAPLLDDPDTNEKRVIKRLQQLGVVDAFKLSKEDVDYSSAKDMPDKCALCKHWENQIYGQGLSTCQLVDGLVRDSHWCEKFEAGANGNQAGGNLSAGGSNQRPNQGSPGPQANSQVGGSQGLQQGPPGRGQGNPPE